MTYTELVAAIQNYSENSFDYSTTPSILNRFIEQAEQTIYNSVQLPSLRKNVNGVTSANNRFLACPDDWLATYYPNPSDTGLPLYYSLYGPQTSQPAELTFLLAPTPDAVYTMILNYFFYPQSIVTAGNTWLGDNFDIALLNYSLVEAITYMKGEQDMVALYKGRAESAMALLKQLGDAKEKGDSFRDPPPKYKVI
jgi:hypothetical protein